MAEKEYIERDKAIKTYIELLRCPGEIFVTDISDILQQLPAADVLPRDEAIKMGAELAAMHGSDAASQQLEEAYLKGVEDGMTRRDARPVVHGKWVVSRTDYGWNCAEYPTHCKCTVCGREVPYQDKDNFCPNCGADMRPTSMSGANGEES